MPCPTWWSAKARATKIFRETHEILKRLRAEVDAAFPGRMLLAEVNQWPEDTKDYFGDGDECHMAFHFPLMPRMYMAIAPRGPLPDHRHHAADAGDPGQAASGPSSCAITTN